MTAHQKPRGSRLLGAERSNLAAELKLKYENGSAVRHLAEEYDRSYGMIHALLTEAGTELRPRGGNHRAA